MRPRCTLNNNNASADHPGVSKSMATKIIKEGRTVVQTKRCLTFFTPKRKSSERKGGKIEIDNFKEGEPRLLIHFTPLGKLCLQPEN